MSGRYDEWRKSRKVSVPRVGEDEGENARRFGGNGKKFRHTMQKEGKPLDKLATDYERRSRVMGKKREAREGAVEEDSGRGQSKGGKLGSGKGKLGLAKRGGKPAGRVKSELKSAEQIRRDRALAKKKRAKNARAPKKGKGAGKGRR